MEFGSGVRYFWEGYAYHITILCLVFALSKRHVKDNFQLTSSFSKQKENVGHEVQAFRLFFLIVEVKRYNLFTVV